MRELPRLPAWHITPSLPSRLIIRESLKASSEQTHAALREAELRAGKAAAAGDASSRDAEAARAEVSQLKAALVDLDADRDRLQVQCDLDILS